MEARRKAKLQSLQKSMLGKLSAFLTRDGDRKLFGLGGRHEQAAKIIGSAAPQRGCRVAQSAPRSRHEALPGRFVSADDPSTGTGDRALDRGEAAARDPAIARDDGQRLRLIAAGDTMNTSIAS